VEDLVAPWTSLDPGRALVLRQTQRRGFAAAVNLGIATSERDAVMLNSDTQVTAGWLEKLRAAAYSAPEVGTVTPFTSYGSICSLPVFLAENTVPAGYTVDSFATLVERVSQRCYTRLPTGVGFCMYVRRALLSRVGPLDERFGLGYGEETDLCRRGTAAGFVHVLDDATYVWHRGRASFGAEREGLMRRAEARMRHLHPTYMRAVIDFIGSDPLAPARERVLRALAPPPGPGRLTGPRRVLHLVSGWPPFDAAEPPAYAQALACRQAAHRQVSAYVAEASWPGRHSGEALEHYDRGVHVRMRVNGDGGGSLAHRLLERRRRLRDFSRFLRSQKPDLVHVHGGNGHGAVLASEVVRQRLPIVYAQREPSRPREAETDRLGMDREAEQVEALYAEILTGRRTDV
jgi:hypothetical protein